MGSPTVIRDLEGKVALVTGATSGIGEATAVQLARQGAAVIVHGRDVTCGAAVVTEIEKSSGSAWFVGADLSEPAEALRLAGAVGDVDILVNNAGFAWFGRQTSCPSTRCISCLPRTSKPRICWCRRWARKWWAVVRA
jgi:NAD(P)-dependent dehydrogenase (short-subunit alcohol dehydrogenase family)